MEEKFKQLPEGHAEQVVVVVSRLFERFDDFAVSSECVVVAVLLCMVQQSSGGPGPFWGFDFYLLFRFLIFVFFLQMFIIFLN